MTLDIRDFICFPVSADRENDPNGEELVDSITIRDSAGDIVAEVPIYAIGCDDDRVDDSERKRVIAKWLVDKINV